MIRYEKPVISVDAGMAEGIYAASGVAQNTVTFSEFTPISVWGESGQLKFTVDLSKLSNLSQLTLVITFNTDIANLWGGGANVQHNGKTATLYWYAAPSTAELTVQVNSNLSNLQITGSAYTNA